ncbi:OLC1v1010040C1 [Oldenlandia corymbosa var. corymbosa]|uniref:OLC1v1010040C1 n=1 Tax=Oldenlandia corymbosa var. corymbosa TaxID=529605 RepID=A0AAV1DQE3_OLDCO|nr:OLC1v1010040C1 [Oldenlandia corymbosa var. corymbosa]
MFVVNHSSQKSVPNIVEVNYHIMATSSGGSNDTLELLRWKCREYEAKTGRSISVANAAKFVAGIVTPIMCTEGILIGGWDDQKLQTLNPKP